MSISRNGPPDAVRTMRWTSERRWPSRHWKTALCSESTGRSGTRRSRAAAVIKLPAQTKVGQHKLHAKYGGSAQVAGSGGPTVTLTVTK